ncbi:response regulator [Phormidesmis sp. 146-35]
MSKRILIIDDDDDIRAVAQVTLQAVGGWQVMTAASGSEGVAIATCEPLDLILLDVMMPDMDGIDTLQALQATPATRSIPVLFMTAKAQAAELRRFAKLNIAGIITKPFKAMQLPAQISAALGW